MTIVPDMRAHFSQVAPDYRQARTTDSEPIAFISENLQHLPEVSAADVGCGAGRYDLLLFQHLNNLKLTCIDINESMLAQASEYLTDKGFSNFKTLEAKGDSFSLAPRSLDCVLTFNAIHHFDFAGFLESAAKALKESGQIFIYTRLRSQNARNIWGEYFPGFTEKEDRLYEMDRIESWIASSQQLTLKTVKRFEYERTASLEQLLKKVKVRHYSTFSLYEKGELAEALPIFEERLGEKFSDLNQIKWFDENILLVLQAES
ncbi:MAG: class I SAM-dependent methyltransferase [Oscillatoria sp. SIO1A7]|nr:class I SAM-dependent methyltransferase [Oscillatoria sp. SIO1A7]